MGGGGGGRLQRAIWSVALAGSLGACVAEPPIAPSAPVASAAPSVTRSAPAPTAPVVDPTQSAPAADPVPSAAGVAIVVRIDENHLGALRVSIVSDGLVTAARAATDRDNERGGL